MTTQPLNSHCFHGATAHEAGLGMRAGVAFKLAELVRRVRERAAEEIRYRQALRELKRLDDRDLDDLAIGRADLPEIARRHARATG
jgi:uncharacterized protein YjiS (DUF1127 family)